MPELTYRINDADNHFNEPPDCFERYIDPGKVDLAIRHVVAPDGSEIQLFAGRPSKFTSTATKQVTFSSAELDEMLGDTTNVGVGRVTGLPRNDGELDVVPGSLLNRLNPLKGLSDAERREFIEEFRSRAEAFGNRDLRLALMDEQGIDKALMFPAAAHDIEYEFADRIDALYANIRAFNRWMHEEVGFISAGPHVVAAVHLVRRSRARGAGARAGHGPGCERHPDQVGPRARRTGRSLRRPLARRSRLRPLLEHLQRSRRATGRAPRRHRLPEVRRRLVGGSGERLLRVQRVPVGQLLGRPSRDGAHVGAGAAELLRSLPQHEGVPVGTGHRVGALHHPQDGSRVPHGPQGEVSETGRLDQRPSEIFRQHFVVAPFPEENVRRVVAEVGIEPIVFGSDFPHGEGLAYPAAYADAQLADFSDEDVRTIMRDNLEQFLVGTR